MIPTLYEPFRHWSDGGSVYILSDLHFDDEDCKFMSPDWITPRKQLSIINGIVMKMIHLFAWETLENRSISKTSRREKRF